MKLNVTLGADVKQLLFNTLEDGTLVVTRVKPHVLQGNIMGCQTYK